jgi:para-nitrobenzyl esterase
LCRFRSAKCSDKVVALLRALVLTALLGSYSTFADTVKESLLTVNGEQLRGQIDNGVAIFRGIPFAQPPIGELRWREPRSAVPRTGVQSALTFAPACMQTSYNTDWYRDIVKAFGEDADLAPTPNAISEDCLYLNIWSPQLGSNSRLPVVVYIYGGNNLGGWSYEPNYLGHNLAAKGAVVVSIAYRLGVFGFLAHPQLTQESANASSGNYGLLDQIKALEWVKRNISAFGGDRANVTVMGESAGGANISHLMLSPLAKGLFKNAIRQSAAFDIRYRDSLDREEVFGLEFATDMSASAIEQLRNLPASEILAGAQDYYLGSDNEERRNFYGVVDGYVLPQSSEVLYRTGKVNPTNVLLGSNADEKLMYAPQTVSEQDIDRLISRYYKKGKRRQVWELVEDQATSRKKYAKLMDAKQHSCMAQLEADYMVSHKIGDIYLYYFTRVRPGAGGELLGAYHGAELPYAFDTHDDWLSGDKIDDDLSEALMNYWLNFARTGNPNAQDLPHWPQYRPDARIAMELGNTVSLMDAPNRRLCDLLKSLEPPIKAQGGETED